MNKRIFAVLTAVLTAGCSYLGYVKDPFVDIPNFYKVTDELYRGGQPNQDGLKKLKSLNIKTVISLRGEDEETKLESKSSQDIGLKFYNIPMSVYRQPSDGQVMEFLDIVLEKSNQPVFVHCESGRDRTGAMVALYQVVVNNKTIKEAYHEAKKAGFWPYYGDAELKKFIHGLKDHPEYFEKTRSINNE